MALAVVSSLEPPCLLPIPPAALFARPASSSRCGVRSPGRPGIRAGGLCGRSARSCSAAVETRPWHRSRIGRWRSRRFRASSAFHSASVRSKQWTLRLSFVGSMQRRGMGWQYACRDAHMANGPERNPRSSYAVTTVASRGRFDSNSRPMAVRCTRQTGGRVRPAARAATRRRISPRSALPSTPIRGSNGCCARRSPFPHARRATWTGAGWWTGPCRSKTA